MVAAAVLGTVVERRVGSNPSTGTIGRVDNGCQTVLKTVGQKRFAGSNPVSSAIFIWGISLIG